ncbi:hypothetical protein, partial [Mycobacterium avium]
CARHESAGACPYANICETCDNYVTAPIRTTHHNHLSDPGNGRVRSFTRYDTLMPTRPVPQQPETRYLHWSARGGFAWCAMALYDQLRHPFWTSTRRA